MTVEGSAKLLDFGLAKLMTEADSDVTQTIERTILGTAAIQNAARGTIIRPPRALGFLRAVRGSKLRRFGRTYEHRGQGESA